MSEYTVVTHAGRPDLDHDDWSWCRSAWSEFMLHDPVCHEFWSHLTVHVPWHQVYLLDGEGEGIGVGNAILFAWDGRPDSLPEGIDGGVPPRGAGDGGGHRANGPFGRPGVVHPEHQGWGVSRVLPSAMGGTAREAGLNALVAPVRPTVKPRYPFTPMDRYVCWRRDDGLPLDSWMRVHARLGAEVLGVCPRSMTITGTISQWERWTGMAFPESGEYVVPGALVPVDIDRGRDEGR